MFIAHIFGGYLGTRLCLRCTTKQDVQGANLKYYLLFGLLCSVLPDFDLAYFYLIDHRQHPHHTYWTHIPIFWVILASLTYVIGHYILKKRVGLLSIILLSGTCLHLILDSVAGGIYWLYPFSSTYYRLFTITPRYDWWVLNYLLHWTFLLEILIIVTSIYFMRKDYRRAAIGYQEEKLQISEELEI